MRNQVGWYECGEQRPCSPPLCFTLDEQDCLRTGLRLVRHRLANLGQMKDLSDLRSKQRVCDLRVQVFERFAQGGRIAYGRAVEVAEGLHREVLRHECP